MLSATVIRRLEALETISKQGKPINGIFRLLEDPILWHEAYANIYANKGAMTPGVDEVCKIRGKDRQNSGVKTGIADVSSTQKNHEVRDRGGGKDAEIYGTSNHLLPEAKRLE